jgi:CRISPR/Cas system CMR-associated protein Cmr5 small subunit
MQTRQQTMAQKAWTQVQAQSQKEKFNEYITFAKNFPALIHSCGLDQAVSFARAKKKEDYLSDFIEVLASVQTVEKESNQFLSAIHQCNIGQYIRFSRIALQAAEWIKRYAEALDQGESHEKSAQ